MDNTATTPWRKSSFSGTGGACVELRSRQGLVEVRDSKLGAGSPVLGYNREEITALVAGVCAGEFDDLLDKEQLAAIRELLAKSSKN